MNSPTKCVNVRKTEPLKCPVCGSTNTVYTVSYTDMSQPKSNGLPYRAQLHSCCQHLEAVTTILFWQEHLGYDQIP